ncbi:MAG: ATP-binding cassette domain-containing protein [Chloroflexi bacterium]|nr:ATP-binding cassette domain-containing protein [Chloroflexota bacterium]
MALLEARGISVSFISGRNVLEAISLTIEAGEFAFLLGPNGSGKTTLLRTFAGLLKPNQGKVLLAGREISQWKPADLYAKIGFVFQDPNDQLFASTVAQDVAFGPQNLGLPALEIENRLTAALREVDMLDHKDRAIQTLSFGQKRRVALAGVLAMQPEIIFLDEPTSGLDPRTAIRIMHLFLGLARRRGVTLLMATHDVDLASLYATNIYVLDRGQIVTSGAPPSVFSELDVLRDSDLRLPVLVHASRIGALNSQAMETPLTLEGLPAGSNGIHLTRGDGPSDIFVWAAASSAAASLLFHDEKIEKVELRTPAGDIFAIRVDALARENGVARAEVAGNDSTPAFRVVASATNTGRLEIQREGANTGDSLVHQAISDAVAGLAPEGVGLRIMLGRGN